MATALFPGSFDPFTAGHEAILRRVLPLFDRIIVAVGVNSDKHYMFSIDERIERIRTAMSDCPTVEVTSYNGMTIDLCHQLGAQAIIRGIRGPQDFEYEQLIATVNRQLDPTIETLLILADAEHKDISSTLEREKITHNVNKK